MEDHTGYFEARADNIINKGLLDETSVAFYRALFELQGREYGRFASLPSLPPVGAEDLPLSRHAGIVLTDDLLASVAGGAGPLGAVMAEHHPGLVLEPLLGPLARDRAAFSELGAVFLALDHERLAALSLRYKTGIEECVFILTNLLRPVMTLLREKSAPLIPPAGSPLLCPFCGHYPDMSVIGGGEEGRRLLHCSLCGHRWPFKRLSCAVCGTEDPAKLEYLSSEGDTRYRIDVCHECGGYIKTVRLDKFEEVDSCDLAVENILTAGLDGAAMREGYRRP